MTTSPDVPRLLDRAAFAAARRRTRAAGGGPDFLTARVAEDMADRLAATLRPFPRALDLASPGAAIADALRARPGAERVVRAAFEAGDGGDLVADPQAIPLAAESFDLVVSGLALQFADDLPGVFAQVRRLLRPDGLFLVALLGGDTLTELRQSFAAAEAEIDGGLSPRVMPFADVRAVGALLQRAGLALPVTDVDKVTVRYGSPIGLMQDLRAWGATNALVERNRRPLKRATLARALEVYAERFADADGRVRATFEIVWASGWAPHASQQQPLKPGSAKARLADALRPPKDD
ncbi:methyltransferase domain-containing protein [Chenggangzhangella methanolivorans]|uniref:Methyltransferase domain-containing protein n=1 Tax=Chenggangzhangella methanolivorans TaxID=1437009 RepID=A0A9E6RBR0_9HYPH|nr:methyltransferase domain-containing protein [Chenggangzhangella methanolivorans]QZO01868.1 methyltransferase domain-containing protein [Chenggangzhangella methanolivorans]